MQVILTDTHLGIVMEYADVGNLLDYVRKTGPLPEDQARRFFQQVQTMSMNLYQVPANAG